MTQKFTFRAPGGRNRFALTGLIKEFLQVTVDGNLADASYEFATGFLTLSNTPQKGALVEASYVPLKASTAGGFVSGQLSQFSNDTGIPPDGWKRASGLVRSQENYSQFRMRLIPFLIGTGWSASDISSGHRVLSDRKLVLVSALGTAKATLILDLDTGNWTEAPSTWAGGSTTHSYANFVASGNKLYLFGSAYTSGTPYTYNYTTRILDLDTLTFSNGAALSTERGRRGYAAGKLSDGRILVVGGTVGSVNSGSSALVDIYDPIADQWVLCDNLPVVNNTGGDVVALANGRAVVRVTGGTFLFDPAAAPGTQWEAIENPPGAIAFGGTLPNGQAVVGTTTGRTWTLTAEKTWLELNYAYGSAAMLLTTKGVSQSSDGMMLAANSAVGFFVLIDTGHENMPNTSVSFYTVKE